jgi:hypothetical protein
LQFTAGDTVLLRKETGGNNRFRVESVDRTSAVIVGKSSERLEVEQADLLVVKPFGEPVYPVLKLVDKVTRDTEKFYHSVINGENFHALQLALFGFEGKIDFNLPRSAI